MDSLDPRHNQTEVTRQTYNQAAGLFVARATDGGLDRQFQQFAAMVPHGGLVLDIGCGPGWHCLELNRRGYRAIGLDLSEGMLAEARVSAVAWLALANMRRLPFADARVDGLWICASFLHVPRSNAATTLAEFHRMLRPGGALDLGVKRGSGEQVMNTLGGLPRLFVFWTDAALDAALGRAGFAITAGWTDEPEPGRANSDSRLNRFAISQ